MINWTRIITKLKYGDVWTTAYLGELSLPSLHGKSSSSFTDWGSGGVYSLVSGGIGKWHYVMVFPIKNLLWLL